VGEDVTDTHREFKAILYSKLPTTPVAEKKENRPEEWKQIIEFCKEPRSRKEIAEYTGKTQNYIMQQWIKPMIEQKLLKMTNPDKPKSRYQKFVKTGE
jgi:ATP-dependent DNA helicase RecG